MVGTIRNRNGLTGPVAFVIFGSFILFSMGFTVDNLPESNPLKDQVIVPSSSTADEPVNANLIDKAVSTVQNFVEPFIGISSTNPVLAIVFAVLKVGIGVSLALILKDMIPFT